MNGIKMGLGITPGEHIISANSALSRNIRHCFCLSCRGRLILQTDAQGAWFEHALHALSAQQKAACVVLNPGPTLTLRIWRCFYRHYRLCWSGIV